MRNTRSIASTVYDCPIYHINSDAPQIYGYQSFFTLNDNPMGKIGNKGEHSMPMTIYFAICNFSCPDIVFLDLPRIPPKEIITSFILSKLITMFFGRIVLQTSIQLMSSCILQVECPSWKELIKLPYFLRESTSHATSILSLVAYLTFAATAQLSDLSFFNTDSTFWVCDNSGTGHICKDKLLFVGDQISQSHETCSWDSSLA